MESDVKSAGKVNRASRRLASAFAISLLPRITLSTPPVFSYFEEAAILFVSAKISGLTRISSIVKAPLVETKNGIPDVVGSVNVYPS
ncbi:hypothetical protein D3C73_1028610 [compost metagenome]